jgi:hypothetical protein
MAKGSGRPMPSGDRAGSNRRGCWVGVGRGRMKDRGSVGPWAMPGGGGGGGGGQPPVVGGRERGGSLPDVGRGASGGSGWRW